MNPPWFTHDGETRTVKVGGRYHVNDARVLRDAAITGWGIIIQGERLVAGDLASGRLVRVLPDRDGEVRPMHLLFPAARPLTSKLRSFVDLVAQEFGWQCLRLLSGSGLNLGAASDCGLDSGNWSWGCPTNSFN
ncbi:hypothetical protein HN018_03915 [Lichenicola cladoniae]|uniref:LysR substrate-binding domain-containing protein n=1 Tax=Lichenicola cladoniae TaxID=1484109 RepID=A0A6M8HLR2_9PROT|nr:hypothetical protein HN018_03915 [Lichenicola cladoniae]